MVRIWVRRNVRDSKLIGEIWASFMRLPMWVRLWMVLWLVPVNLVSLGFWGQVDPVSGITVALLANLGMAFNLPIMMHDRGIGKAMALPHLLFWTPLVILIAVGLASDGGTSGYRSYLAVLIVTNLVSLAFDYKDAWAWWRGDRGIA